MTDPIGQDLKLETATTELIDSLNDLAGLSNVHKDTTSDYFKRVVALFALTAVQDFLDKMDGPRDVLRAIDEVRGGIFDMNAGNPSQIFTIESQGKPPAPTNFEVIRAQVSALVIAITSNVGNREKAQIVRDLRAKLLPQLNVIFDQSADTKDPERALTNTAGRYRRDEISNDLAREYFRYWSDKYEKAFSKVEPARRQQLISAVIKQIKVLIDDTAAQKA